MKNQKENSLVVEDLVASQVLEDLVDSADSADSKNSEDANLEKEKDIAKEEMKAQAQAQVRAQVRLLHHQVSLNQRKNK